MKISKKSIVLAAVLAGSLGVQAQDASGRVKVGDAEGRVNVDLPERERDRNNRSQRLDRDADRDRLEVDAEGRTERNNSVRDINKASNLMGMEIKNSQGETLGEVQDLVVDVESGKIAYVVMAVGGFLGVGEKYIAVPPSELSSPSAGPGKHLVLEADKARIEAAPGFVKTDWPNMNDPQVESFWSRDAIGAADVDVRTDTGVSTRNADPGISNTRRDRISRDDLRSSDRNTTRSEDLRSSDRKRDENRISRPNTSIRNEDASEVFRGKITKINPETRIMTVSGESGSRSFVIADKANITLKENRNPRLSDLKVGFPVTIGYHNEGDIAIAHSVTRADAPEVR